jgi:hypothetical protein
MHRSILHPGAKVSAPLCPGLSRFLHCLAVSYLSSDVFAVCKCLILLARWEPLTPCDSGCCGFESHRPPHRLDSSFTQPG